jgi:hypothetical protein
MNEETTTVNESGMSTEGDSWLSKQTIEVQDYIKKLRDESARNRQKAGLDKLTLENEQLKAEIKKKKDDEALEKQQFKELYESEKKNKSDLEKQLKAMSDELTGFKEVYEKERLELLEKLNPDERETFKDLSKSQLQKILEKTIISQNSVGSQNTAKDLDDVMKITQEQWETMAYEKPEQYNILMTKKLQMTRKERNK